MNVPKVFWVFLALFEIAFGGLVFIVTKSYYQDQNVGMPVIGQESRLPGLGDASPQSLSAPAIDLSAARSPEEIARLADEHFTNHQYDAAAMLYEQLLEQDPGNVDLLNNLAITLHYVGRSDEALGLVDKGVLADPNHQRIWLTRGFILSQTGSQDQAISALNKAVELNATTPIADSARKMLSEIEAE